MRGPPDPVVRHPYLTRRAVGYHLTLVVLLVAFCSLFWWQIHRALAGNDLSWAYVVEWPVFGAYAVFVWWQLVHDGDWRASSPRRWRAQKAAGPGHRAGPGADAGTGGSAPAGPDGSEPVVVDPVDEELAAYNRYLAELAASDRRKHW